METRKFYVIIQFSLLLNILLFSSSVSAQTELNEGIQFVNLDGYKFEVKFQGKQHLANGIPIVVFEAGIGGSSLKNNSWTAVLDSIAEFAPVFSYSHSGMGNSEWNGIEPTPKNIASTLHNILERLELPKPYVMLGHSWGGVLIRYFAGYYPQDVKALIYVEPDNFMAEPGEGDESFIKRGIDPEEADKFERAGFAEFLKMTKASEGLIAESKAVEKYWDKSVADRELGADPEKPMVLLLGTKGFPSYPPTPEGLTKPWDDDDLWFEAHIEQRMNTFSKWPLMFKNCLVIISSKAWHHFHKDEPDLVIEMTKKMLKE